MPPQRWTRSENAEVLRKNNKLLAQQTNIDIKSQRTRRWTTRRGDLIKPRAPLACKEGVPRWTLSARASQSVCRPLPGGAAHHKKSWILELQIFRGGGGRNNLNLLWKRRSPRATYTAHHIRSMAIMRSQCTFCWVAGVSPVALPEMQFKLFITDRFIILSANKLNTIDDYGFATG